MFSFIGFSSLGLNTLYFSSAYTGLLISVMLYAIGGGFLEVLVSPVIDSIPKEEEKRAAEMSILHAIFCWSQVAVIIGTTLFLKIAGNENWRIIAAIWALIPLFNIVMFIKVPLMPTVAEDEEKKNKKIIIVSRFFYSITGYDVCWCIRTGNGAMGIFIC